MRLFIAEKPELARAIVAGLGGGERKNGFYLCKNDDVVTWCIGHLLELLDPVEYDEKYKHWDIDFLPFFYFPVRHKIKKDMLKHTLGVIRLIKKATLVVHAGDPDREGQLIVDQLIKYCHYKGQVLRFETNDNTYEMVKNSLANLRDNTQFNGLYQAGLGRQIADQLYGYNLTMGLSSLYKKQGGIGQINVGRVKTPVLSLIVNRTLINKHHKSSFYYAIKGIHSNGIFINYKPSDTLNLNDKGFMLDKTQATQQLHLVQKGIYKVISVDTNTSKKYPPLPFNIINLQIACAKSFGMKPGKVMEITQTLRETHNLITYNGTDCCYLNDVHFDKSKEVFSAVFSYLKNISTSAFDPTIKSKCFNDKKVSAHHAIIPTANLKCKFSELSEDELKVYQLISTQYLIQFYPPASFIERTLKVSDGTHVFSSTFKHCTSLGFLELMSPNVNKVDSVASFEMGDIFDMTFELKEIKTSPPKLYTYATLLKDLTQIAKYVESEDLRKILIAKDDGIEGEKGGIGTPRTRDLTISSLVKSKFIREKESSLIATAKGTRLIKQLPKSITQPDMTALWHEQLLQVENGSLKLERFLEFVFAFVKKEITHLKKNGFDFDVTLPPCPTCKADLKRLYSTQNNSHFWCCSIPSCNYSCDDKNGQPVKN